MYKTIYKTINIEQTDGSLVLKSYIAIDQSRKWYLHQGMFAGTYGIHNYETGEFVCGLYENGTLGSTNKVGVNDFAAIKKLYLQIPGQR